MGVSPQVRQFASRPRPSGLGLRHLRGADRVRYDLSVTTDQEGLVESIGWTVRDARGDALAIGTWMGDVLHVLTLQGALLETLDQALAADQQLIAFPGLGEY